jgi:hypothetical protein
MFKLNRLLPRFATVSIPQMAWIASLLATTATTQSGSLTVTVNITQGWQITLPIQMTWKSGVSADGVINAYPSSDGGVTYDSNPAFSVSVARAGGSVTKQTSIILPTGQWAIQILNSGPSTGSAAIPTASLITAILNT